MLIAIPTDNGQMSGHFGHAPHFTLYTIENNEVVEKKVLPSPPHQPGLLPQFLGEQNVDIIIAGNMGSRAKELFAQNGIKVVCGVGEVELDEIIEQYITGVLKDDPTISCGH